MKYIRQLLLLPIALVLCLFHATIGWLLTFLIYGYDYANGYVKRECKTFWIL